MTTTPQRAPGAIRATAAPPALEGKAPPPAAAAVGPPPPARAMTTTTTVPLRAPVKILIHPLHRAMMRGTRVISSMQALAFIPSSCPNAAACGNEELRRGGAAAGAG